MTTESLSPKQAAASASPKAATSPKAAAPASPSAAAANGSRSPSRAASPAKEAAPASPTKPASAPASPKRDASPKPASSAAAGSPKRDASPARAASPARDASPALAASPARAVSPARSASPSRAAEATASPAKDAGRKSVGAARKSTGGRKSIAKKALARKDSFAIGDLVWAHMRGFPYWPAKVIKVEDVPQRYLKDRKGSETCIMFFGTFEFGFLSKDNIFPFAENLEVLSAAATGGVPKALKQAQEEPEAIEAKIAEIKATSTHDELEDEAAPASGRKSTGKGKTPKKEAASGARKSSRASATPSGSRKRKSGASDDESAGEKRSKRSRAGDDKKAEQQAGRDETLMKWRHILQKTFIKDKACNDNPRIHPDFISTADWAGVTQALDDFNTYVNSAEFDAEAVNNTKLPKVIKMIQAKPEVESPTGPLLEHKIRDKVAQLAASLNSKKGDSMETA